MSDPDIGVVTIWVIIIASFCRICGYFTRLVRFSGARFASYLKGNFV